MNENDLSSKVLMLSLVNTGLFCFCSQTLRDNLHFLCNNLDVDDHYIFLEDRGVLSRDSAERIRKVPCTRKDRVYEMISELSRGPSNSFDALCESIKNETVQQFMADRLLQSFEEACQRYVQKLLEESEILHGSSWNFYSIIHVPSVCN